MHALIPFGKYKNQPVEVLAQDKAYCDWLISQGWVVERFPQIHTLILNHFGEPADTPEHNALQLRFLEEDLRAKVSLCAALFRHPWGEYFRPECYVPFLAQIGTPRFEKEGIDVAWDCELWVPDSWTSSDPACRPGWKTRSFGCIVECKPTLGDDYPAVLRFMHSLASILRTKIVVVETCTFRGGTVEQVRQLFQSSGVLLLQVAELETLPTAHVLLQNALPEAYGYKREAS